MLFCTQTFLQVMAFSSLLCLKTAHRLCCPILYLNQTGSQLTKQQQNLANQCFTAIIKPYTYKWNVTLKTRSQFLQAVLIHINCYRRQPHSFHHLLGPTARKRGQWFLIIIELEDHDSFISQLCLNYFCGPLCGWASGPSHFVWHSILQRTATACDLSSKGKGKNWDFAFWVWRIIRVKWFISVSEGWTAASVSAMNSTAQVMTISLSQIPPTEVSTRPPPQSIISLYKTSNISMEFL